MRIDSVNNSQIIQKQQNFKGNSANSSSLGGNDEINNSSLLDKNDNIALTKINNKKNEKLGFGEKLLLYPSLTRIPAFLPITYGIYHLIKAHSLKKKIKKSLLPEEKLNEFKKASSKKLLIFCASAVPVYFLTKYINKKCEDKNFAKAQEQVEYFNSHNGTNIELIKIPSTKNNKRIAASFANISGKIKLLEHIPGDAIYANFSQKYIINHELTHAKQYMLMARSENGINKLNYITVKNMAKELDDEKKKLLYTGYKDIEDDGFKDGGTRVNIDGYKINYNDFVTAIYKFVYEKDTNPDNYPIIINKNFYEQAKAAKGPLTEAEEKKAQAYFEALEKYAHFERKNSALSKENKDYRENLIEKEASDASYTKYIT